MVMPKTTARTVWTPTRTPRTPLRCEYDHKHRPRTMALCAGVREPMHERGSRPGFGLDMGFTPEFEPILEAEYERAMRMRAFAQQTTELAATFNGMFISGFTGSDDPHADADMDTDADAFNRVGTRGCLFPDKQQPQMPLCQDGERECAFNGDLDADAFCNYMSHGGSDSVNSNTSGMTLGYTATTSTRATTPACATSTPKIAAWAGAGAGAGGGVRAGGRANVRNGLCVGKRVEDDTDLAAYGVKSAFIASPPQLNVLPAVRGPGTPILRPHAMRIRASGWA